MTAKFHDASLMKSAGSITVVDQLAIQERAAQHLESVLSLSPNINFSSGASRARFVQVRGVGDLEQFVDPKHFPSVGIQMDDINLGGTANAGMLFDTRQVEILRGPQGTRFGASALAGLINIRSNDPTDSFEGYLQSGAGNYGSWNLGGVISGPLTDNLTGRLAVQQNRGDGYIDNTFLGRDDTNGYDEQSIRAKLRFEPNDTTRYDLTAYYFEGENGYDAFSLDNNRNTLSDQPGHDNQDTLALAARGEWQLNDRLSLQAVATWLDTELEYGYDEDWSFVGICDGTLCDPVWDFFSNTDNYLRDREEVSLDIRLLGSTSSPKQEAYHYVVGLYLQQRDDDLHRQYYGDFYSAYETQRQALYGQLEVPLGERLTLTSGLRLEQFEDDYADSLGSGSDTNDDLWSGDLTLSYQVSEQTLLYATLARGNKAGAVNTEANANLPFMQPVFQTFMQSRLRVDTETLLNKELGIKGRYFGQRLALRAALFHMDRDNAQLESWMWDADNFLWIGFLDNADGSNYGLELEAAWQLNRQLELFSTLGWLETEIDSITTFDLDTSDFVTRKDIDQAKAPSWQFNTGFNWAMSEQLHFRLEVEGRDESNYGYYHDRQLNNYALLHASLRYQIGNLELQLWGRNLTDKDYAVHGLYFGNDPRKGWINENYRQLGEPMLVGLTGKYHF